MGAASARVRYGMSDTRIQTGTKDGVDGHLLIGSRTAPPLPIRRLQAAEEAVVVEQRALAFTDDELAELAQRSATRPGCGGGSR